MIRNGKDIPNGKVITTQVCVIGSGPAGVTLAWELQKQKVKVVLIEGSRDYQNNVSASWPDKVKLYEGLADGLFKANEPDFLVRPYSGGNNPSERERIYGGTSTHWGGQSRPLDPITFQKRPGFPGWPITRKDLNPYYAMAATLCGLTNQFGADYWAQVLGDEVPKLDGFDTEMYQFMGRAYRNFAIRDFEGRGTIGQSAADVILNASLLQIDQSGGAVTEIKVASMDDSPSPKKATEFTVRADVYVLACGAVANAQQLLLSKAGNEHDQVGRNFLCHPLTSYGVISINGTYLTPGEQRLMNGQQASGATENTWVSPTGATLTGRFSPTAEQQLKQGIGSCWFWAGGGQYYFEMAPNPESRVTLATTKDPVFGQPQAHITWLLSDLDKITYTQTTQMFQASVSSISKKKASVSYPGWDQVKSSLVVNGHHIGTTRMSADPADGVVDADLKVHSLANLFVAGSSVFPTTGISNPTFTIIALSIRLAEHLIDKLGPAVEEGYAGY